MTISVYLFIYLSVSTNFVRPLWSQFLSYRHKWWLYLKAWISPRVSRFIYFYTSFTFWDRREKRIFENAHLRLKGLSPWKNNFTVGFVAFFPTTFPSSLFCYDQPNLRKSGFCVFSYVFNAKFKTAQKPYYLISTYKT